MASQQDRIRREDKQIKKQSHEEEPKVMTTAHSATYVEVLRAPKVVPVADTQTHSNIPTKTHDHEKTDQETHQVKESNMGRKGGEQTHREHKQGGEQWREKSHDTRTQSRSQETHQTKESSMGRSQGEQTHQGKESSMGRSQGEQTNGEKQKHGECHHQEQEKSEQKGRSRGGEETHGQKEWRHRQGQEKKQHSQMGGGRGEERHGAEQGQRGGQEQQGQGGDQEESQKSSPSLEEIGKYRGQAQQNSMEAIRAAEEKYNKAKEALGNMSSYVAEKGGEVKEKALETRQEGAKYTAENTQQGLGTAKDTIVGVGKTAFDYTLHTAEQAKEFAAEKTPKVKDAAVSVGETAAHYVGQTAVKAKDTGIHVGKSAVGFAGHTAVQAKDVALETGWKVAHYSLEKAAELTEATANLERKAAETSAQRAEQARKEKEHESQQMSSQGMNWEQQQHNEGQGQGGEKWQDVSSDFHHQKLSMENSPTDEQIKRHEEQAMKNKDDGGGILGAVGETLVEIAQSTKEMVIGKEQCQKDVQEQ